MNLVLELDDYDLEEFDFTHENEGSCDSSVKINIRRYFEKQDLDSQKIDLIMEKFSDFVLSTSLIQAVSISYKMIQDNNYCDISEGSNSSIPEDVRFVISLIHKVQKVVSQEFVGGILVLHLIFIEGLKCDGFIQ